MVPLSALLPPVLLSAVPVLGPIPILHLPHPWHQSFHPQGPHPKPPRRAPVGVFF